VSAQMRYTLTLKLFSQIAHFVAVHNLTKASTLCYRDPLNLAGVLCLKGQERKPKLRRTFQFVSRQ